MRRGYVPDPDEYAYDQPRHAGSSGVLLLRAKTVRAGRYLDADIYPVISWDYARQATERKKTPEQMARANRLRAQRNLTQLLNANFTDGDILLTLTCREEMAYTDFVRLKNNYMGRLRRAYKRAGADLRYVGIIESTHEGRQHHIHMVLGGGAVTRDQAEALWKHGTANARTVQTKAEPTGLGGFAGYITRTKSGQDRLMRRAWFCSKGLKRPRATYADRKFSRAAAGRIERAVREDAEREFRKRYPGYQLVDYTVRYSDFLPGPYIHAFMRRLD